ncbi:hypothetical protein Tco_1508643 [Tanacetum coccineum]
MLAPSGEGLILYQAYGNIYAMTGRKAHFLEDKQIPSVGVFDEAFGRNTRDLGSFREEMDKTTNRHQHLSRISTQKLEKASQITCDAVTTHLKTASQDLQTTSDCTKVGDCESIGLLGVLLVVNVDEQRPPSTSNLGRCFLKTSRALIDVYEGEITLRVGKEAITFNLDQTSRYTANFNHMTANRIDVIDMASEEYSQEGACSQKPKKASKLCEAKTVKSSIDEPPEVELKDLPPHLAKELSLGEKADLIKVLKVPQGPSLGNYPNSGSASEKGKSKIPIVIKNEVEITLDAGLIYPISDSHGSAEYHCVPKKGGFTVVKMKKMS